MQQEKLKLLGEVFEEIDGMIALLSKRSGISKYRKTRVLYELKEVLMKRFGITPDFKKEK